MKIEDRCKIATDCLPESEYRTQLENLHADLLALRKDADLLAWILAHPETAAEELEDAASGEGTARSNIENRRAGIAAARFGDA